MLGRREIVTKVYRRGEICIGARHGYIFCRIVAGKRHPLNAGTYRQVIFLLLEPPGQRDVVGIRREGVGVAEQVVEY